MQTRLNCRWCSPRLQRSSLFWRSDEELSVWYRIIELLVNYLLVPSKLLPWPSVIWKLIKVSRILIPTSPNAAISKGESIFIYFLCDLLLRYTCSVCRHFDRFFSHVRLPLVTFHEKFSSFSVFFNRVDAMRDYCIFIVTYGYVVHDICDRRHICI